MGETNFCLASLTVFTKLYRLFRSEFIVFVTFVESVIDTMALGLLHNHRLNPNGSRPKAPSARR